MLTREPGKGCLVPSIAWALLTYIGLFDPQGGLWCQFGSIWSLGETYGFQAGVF